MTISDEPFDLIVIGGGPAGLMAAAVASEQGFRVGVLEKNNRPGKKLLVSGSGQCNLTHSGDIRDFPCHFGKGGKFVRPCLLNFSNTGLEAFFSRCGVETADRGDGKVFPLSGKSQDILEALLAQCRKRDAIFFYKCPVSSLVKKDGFFLVETADRRKILSSSVLIATGGCSYPSTGSTGDGYKLAEKFGHKVVSLTPVLTPVFLRDNPFGVCTGISFPSRLQLFRDGRKTGEYRGDLLLTHKGLSGPVILNNSRDFHSGDRLTVQIDPEGDEKGFLDYLLKTASREGKKTVKKFLTSRNIPERLVLLLLGKSSIAPDLPLSQLGKKSRSLLVEKLFAFPVQVQDLGGFNIAMATGGGISLDEVNPRTMESRLQSDLYFAGEVLDVDGDTGGYNLQFAFSSGKQAADAIRRKRKAAG